MTTLRRPFLVLGLLFIGVLVFSIFLGRYPAPYWMPLSTLRSDLLAQRLVVNLRLPRILAACLLGMSLAAGGTVLQMIFRNPLVEPGFLGVSPGAAFGAAFSILFLDGGPAVVEVTAALFAGLGLAGSYVLARAIRYGGWILRLVLAGIIVSALFSAGLGVLKYMADPLTELPEIVFWTLGALWGVTWADVAYMLPLVVPGLVVVYLMRWRLNVLALPEETAFSMGTAPGRERSLLLAAAVAAVAAVVSVAGAVGWVGLIVPHVSRRLVGADAQKALPASMLIGGTFALLCDDVARTIVAGEVPLGILTALFGATGFLLLMIRRTPQVG
ncbi:MAG: iron ABC transporter permease [Anaerolineae bacterium]|nr:iron ABC transporter permease [Anaerolineae bacterium]